MIQIINGNKYSIQTLPTPKNLRKQYSGKEVMILQAEILSAGMIIDTQYYHNEFGMTKIKDRASIFLNRQQALQYIKLFAQSIAARAKLIAEQPELTFDGTVRLPVLADISRVYVEPDVSGEQPWFRLVADIVTPMEPQPIKIYLVGMGAWTSDAMQAATFSSELSAKTNEEVLKMAVTSIPYEFDDDNKRPFWGYLTDVAFYGITIREPGRKEPANDEPEAPEVDHLRWYCEGSVYRDINLAEQWTEFGRAVNSAAALSAAQLQYGDLEELSDAVILKLRLLGGVPKVLADQLEGAVEVEGAETGVTTAVLPIVIGRTMIIEVVKVTETPLGMEIKSLWQEDYCWIKPSNPEEAEPFIEDELDDEEEPGN